jgi:hypothetical protein
MLDNFIVLETSDRLCGLVILVPGYRSRSPGSIPGAVVGLERGPLILVSTIEELLGRKSSGCGLETREYGHRDPSHLPLDTLYPQKLALTSPTSGGRLFGIVHTRTEAMEYSFFFSWKHAMNLTVETPK